MELVHRTAQVAQVSNVLITLSLSIFQYRRIRARE